MNSQVDIIVIGDTLVGNQIVRNLAAVNPTIKMAFISREFKSTTTHDFLNVEYIKDEVIYVDYWRRLFGCYLKNGDRVYCTHLIIASGLVYEPLVLNNKQVPCVYNDTNDLPKYTKNQPALVIGKNNTDLKLALAVSKKYKYVYLCSNKLELEGTTQANLKKLTEAENIVFLPNTSLAKITAEDNKLKTVELDNYTTLTCSAIFTKTNFSPATSFISDKIIQKDSNGYLITDSAAESLLVPKCYALGNCAVKSTKKMLASAVNSILRDF